MPGTCSRGGWPAEPLGTGASRSRAAVRRRGGACSRWSARSSTVVIDDPQWSRGPFPMVGSRGTAFVVGLSADRLPRLPRPAALALGLGQGLDFGPEVDPPAGHLRPMQLAPLGHVVNGRAGQSEDAG